jgi:hypothetical protein
MRIFLTRTELVNSLGDLNAAALPAVGAWVDALP